MVAKAAPIDAQADADGADCERDESLDEHDVPKIIKIHRYVQIRAIPFSETQVASPIF